MSETKAAAKAWSDHPKWQRVLSYWVLGFFVFVVLLIVFVPAPEKTQEQKEAEAQKQKEAQTSKEANAYSKKMRELKFDCASAWSLKNKHKLRDPDSLKFDYGNDSAGFAKNGDVIVSVPYRARNGFGGMNLRDATCTYDLKTLELISIIQ